MTQAPDAPGYRSRSSAQLLTEYEANQLRARALVQACTRAQLNWRDSGAWGVADCLDHMARSNTLVGRAITAAIAAPRQYGKGLRAPRWLSNWLIRLTEPPPRWRVRAPRPLIPDPREWGEDILDAYVESHEHLVAAIRTSSSADLERISFRHPALPLRLTILAGLRQMAAHDRRHLWQAERVTQSPHFPR